ncbi:TlpA family protein disulfide reductase [Qipengyuania marisflavi]|nr:TlpA disulfide reductase family protein [Qipengyuania marisflavi]
MFVRFSLTLVLTLAAAVGGCDRGAPDAAQETTASPATTAGGTIDTGMAGELMPAVALTDPTGAQLNTGALQGGPVLLNLWATWCAPCVKEMPLLDDLAGEYGDRLRVLTVSQDMGGADKVAAFFAQRDFARLEPWLDPDTELLFALGSSDLPTTVLYDAQGREVWRVSGDYDWASEEARAAIEEAVVSETDI